MVVRIALAGLGALLAAFLAMGTPAAASGTATLVAGGPRVELPFGAPPSPDAVLQVVVLEVRNPGNAPVSLLVTLQDAEHKAQRVEVLRFALFPPDQPGRFVGRANKALDQLTARLGAAPRLLIVGVEFDPVAQSAQARPAIELDVSADWIANPTSGR